MFPGCKKTAKAHITMMRSLIATILTLALAATSFAQTYKPVDQGSAVTFVIKNFGVNSKGSFSGLDGTIVWDPRAATTATFDVTIAATSINTDNDTRDGHLRKDTYFDVEKYPRIRIVSTSIGGPDKSGHYTFNGKLTMKDVTKDVSFPFIVTAMGDDLIFKGDLTI